jgi:hypothetical protein
MDTFINGKRVYKELFTATGGYGNPFSKTHIYSIKSLAFG